MLKIAIIGAGIAGLTTAAALRLHGLEAQVYERRPEWKPEGAGLLVPCNAMQVFNRLGIGQAVVDSGNRIDFWCFWINGMNRCRQPIYARSRNVITLSRSR